MRGYVSVLSCHSSRSCLPDQLVLACRFQPLSDAVKELPTVTERSLQSTAELSEAADSIGGLPLVTKLQQLAARAQALMEDVHNEATDLFAVSGTSM